MNNSKFAVILHGGAGGIGAPDSLAPRKLGLEQARQAAWKALADGASADQGVAEALKVLELNPFFDAGYGGFLSAQGVVRLDVALMRGDGAFFSLLNVERLLTPSQLAYDQLQLGDSRILVWQESFAKRVSEFTKNQLQRYGYVETEDQMIAPNIRALHDAKVVKETGTVGCVCRDKCGNLAAGTSTGGTANKPGGRIGDSPIIGAGVFAENGVGALSATGHGESILRSLLSSAVMVEMRRALATKPSLFDQDSAVLKSIVSAELSRFNKTQSNSHAGLIVMPALGGPVFDFTAKEMSVAWRVEDSSTQNGYTEGLGVEQK